MVSAFVEVIAVDLLHLARMRFCNADAVLDH
jgi:hypothetical protein